MIHLFEDHLMMDFDYSDATDLIFSYRDGEFSTCLVVHGYQNLVKAIGINNIPSVFKNDPSEELKYAVDVESLFTNKKRFYTNQTDSIDPEDYRLSNLNIGGRWYYINNKDQIWTTKIYKGTPTFGAEVDRWNKIKKISANEPESVATDEEWQGPKEIIEICQKNLIEYCVFKKDKKKQSYVRVFIKI